MSNPAVVSLSLATAVANGVCLSQTPAAAGALTLNGSLVSGGIATFDTARRVSITSSGADSAVVFTVTGTNLSGAPITSTVTGVASGSVNTALDFLTVTKVTTSAATAGAITVGTSATGSTPWVQCNFLAKFWALSVAVQVSAANTPTYTVEHTYDDVNAGLSPVAAAASNWSLEPGSFVPPTAWPNTTLVNRATNGEAQYQDQPIMAIRLTITGGTGKATMQVIQSGIGDL